MLVLEILAYYLPDCATPVRESRPQVTRKQIVGGEQRKKFALFCVLIVYLFSR